MAVSFRTPRSRIVNEEPVLVADDDLVAVNGKLPHQQIAFPVDRCRYA
jgi:hypothetical protein